MKTRIMTLAFLAVAAAVSCEDTLQTVPVEPCRLIDSRLRIGQEITDDTTHALFVWNRCGIPYDAVALLVTVTAVNPSGSGHLTVYSYTAPRPLASSLNFNRGLTASGLVLTKISTAISDQGQALRIHARVSDGGSLHWIVDVVAYLK